MSKPVKGLKVGAVAKRLGVSATMVRSLEKLGLAKPARSQSMYLHVVLLCEHPHRSLSLVIASEPTTVRGTPDRTRRARGSTTARSYGTRLVEPRARGLRSSRGGEFW